MTTARARWPASRPYGRATPLLSGNSTVWECNLKHLVTTVEELHDRGVGLRELITERTRARRRMSGRPRKMDVAMLCLAMHAMADRNTAVQDLAKRLGITTSALYMYVNGNGSVKAPGQELLDAAQDA